MTGMQLMYGADLKRIKKEGNRQCIANGTKGSRYFEPSRLSEKEHERLRKTGLWVGASPSGETKRHPRSSHKPLGLYGEMR
jgi:hypothetical protein